MAVAKAPQSPAMPALLLAAIVVLPLLFSPLYLPALRSDESRVDQRLEEPLERIRRRLAVIDENLLAVAAVRARLQDSGVPLTADEAAQVAEAKPELLDELAADLQEGKRLTADRVILRADAESRKLVGPLGPSYVPGLPGRGESFGRDSFQRLQGLIERSQQTLADLDREAAAALALPASGDVRPADNPWANHLAAVVALARARVARDAGWLDRWQAADLRATLLVQLLHVSDLRRQAEACGARAPTAALEAVKAQKAGIERGLAALQQQSVSIHEALAEQAARVEQLYTEAAAARATMAQMDLHPFQATDALAAGSQFTQWRSQYEALSQTARQAEAQADTLKYGALRGGRLAADAEGDLLAGAYEGAEPTRGLGELEARAAALDQAIATLGRDIEELDKQVASLSEAIATLDRRKADLAARADAAATAADATLEKIAALMQSAAQREQEARRTLDAARRFAQASQDAARKRGQTADRLHRDLGGEQRSERLAHIIGDRDTEAAALVLAAEMNWTAAETAAQALFDQRAHDELLRVRSAWLGAEPPPDVAAAVKELHGLVDEYLAAAEKALADAKAAISKISYDDGAGRRISGANLTWQISQLEAGVQLLAAVLAESPDAAADARAKARAALSEAVEGRETSVYLATAAEILKTLE